MEYRIVRISNNLEDYPDCVTDTKEFPHLVDCVEDEMELMIVAENGDYWKEDDFFHMNSITKFKEI